MKKQAGRKQVNLRKGNMELVNGLPGTQSIGVAIAPIVGEVNAGQAAQVRKQLTNLIKNVNTSNFDIMDLLHTIKTAKFYQPKYDSFIDFAKTLDMKVTKAYYLVRIKENMLTAGVPRATYEPLGIAKLRIIAMIDLIDAENHVIQAGVAKVNELVTSGLEPADLKLAVDEYAGNVGEEAFEWLNIKLKKSAKTIVRQAFELVKMQLGSVGKDVDGNHIDASDGRALEMICADFLSDPNQQPDLQMKGSNEAVQTESDLSS